MYTLNATIQTCLSALITFRLFTPWDISISLFRMSIRMSGCCCKKLKVTGAIRSFHFHCFRFSLRFLSTSPKCIRRWVSDSRRCGTPRGVIEFANTWVRCQVMDWRPIQGVLPDHKPCSRERLRIHRDTDQSAMTETAWVISHGLVNDAGREDVWIKCHRF